MLLKIGNKIDKLMVSLNRKKLIYDRTDNSLYLTRYYIFLKERSKFPFNIFLHKFHKSDEPILHDHPWPYATLIVKGGYYEWIPKFDNQGNKICETRIWRSPGYFGYRSANSFHRIELDSNVTCWTLFIPGPQKREWGFLVNNKWIKYDEYTVGHE